MVEIRQWSKIGCMGIMATPSQQGYHVQTVNPLTFILQLPNSSVRCNCASHQPELGLLNCPPQSLILLQYRDYHVPTVPPNFQSITAIANMYNLFLKHSSLSHAFRLFHYILLTNNEPLLYFSVQLFHEYF